jgi:hypothetical protein
MNVDSDSDSDNDNDVWWFGLNVVLYFDVSMDGLAVVVVPCPPVDDDM